MIKLLGITQAIVIVFVVLFTCSSESAPVLIQKYSINDHPRIIINQSDIKNIQKAVRTNSFVKYQFQSLLVEGNSLLNKAPYNYTLGGAEHTLLFTSRRMEERIITLAGLYLITERPEFALRAKQEMLAAVSFPDWYPQHFLDTAEMTAALGIGYDWLYSTLSIKERKIISDGITRLGIEPWLEKIKEKQADYNNNWAQVCNAGETIGALSIAEDIPEKANMIISHARPAMTKIMDTFAPDGGFEEGPVYWNYATAYNVMYIAALDKAIGTDFGAADLDGFAHTGDYRIYSMGPSLQLANFGDAYPQAFPAFQMFWFAQKFHRPEFAKVESRVIKATEGKMPITTKEESSRFAMLGLIWNALTTTTTQTNSKLPLIKAFSRINQAFMRSSWDDPEAFYIGFKGGNAKASHGHLDLGSFVMDAFGERWGLDLGPDSYGLPEYFGAQRWNYYRTRTEAHNTLTIDDENQDLDAVAPVIATGKSSDEMYAVVDLDKAYKAKLKSWKRGIKLLQGSTALVQDEFESLSAVNVVWNFHTRANIRISQDGRLARLVMNNKSLYARIVSPGDAKFKKIKVQIPSPQRSTSGVTNLVIQIPSVSGKKTIAVLFSENNKNHNMKLNLLTNWDMKDSNHIH